MRLSISNIAWDSKYDSIIFALMKQYMYTGLEIAPTKIFSDAPYTKLQEAKAWAVNLQKQYGFSISSMQSIWYGRQENIFGTEQERQILLSYTKEAIDFAQQIGCHNLVFGCPRNRNLIHGTDADIAIQFFRELGDYADQHNTVLAIEANPSIYNTNYINDTKAAMLLVQQVHSQGFKLNLDVGTMIQNNEKLNLLKDNVALINHVHISEPGLGIILKRDLHRELFILLQQAEYRGFVSIEMKAQDNIGKIDKVLYYVRGLCNDI